MLPGTDLELLELLGMGGFGEVWKARHQHRPLLPPVALKFCTDKQAAVSLRREVDLLDRITGKGRHEGVVSLLYAHTGYDPPWLEYEYVEGGDLSALIGQFKRQVMSDNYNARPCCLTGRCYRAEEPMAQHFCAHF